MKIEICEQMIQSWLLHCQQCQIVQTNWSISPLHNISSKNINDAYNFVKKVQDDLNEILETEYITALQESIEEENQQDCLLIDTKTKGNTKTKKIKKLNIIKKSTAGQFIRQCEIDVVGVRLDDGIVNRVFLIDSAFHKNGLGYHDAVATVIKKLIRAVIVGNIIFGQNVDVTVAFVTPKCGSSVEKDIKRIVNIINSCLTGRYPKVTTELYFNESFTNEIYVPLKNEIDKLNNDNDLFMRALNLMQVAEKHIVTNTTSTIKKSSPLKKTPLVSSSSPKTKIVPDIILTPSNEDVFKDELIKKKRAEIIWEYNDGTKYVELWNANNISESSKIKANIQSKTRWRNKEKDGLVQVSVYII